MPRGQLSALVASLDPRKRVEISRHDFLLDAVESFYLAKRFHEVVQSFDNGSYTNRVVSLAMDSIDKQLMRGAVVAVAAANDDGLEGRTSSLPHLIDALRSALDNQPGVNLRAEIVELARIRASISSAVDDPATPLSLRYVKHIRNKWAGHNSLDRQFDGWADADKILSLPLLEDAVVRLVNAHADLSSVIQSSATLTQVLSPGTESATVGDVIPMTVNWGAVTQLAETLRYTAGRQVDALVDQLRCPPGYGTPEDTDWRPESEHQRLRRQIDTAARQAVAATAPSQDPR